MLSRDVVMEAIDADHWLNLRRLVEPDYAAYAAAGPRRLPLVLLLEGGRPVKAVRAGQGRVELSTVRWWGPAAIDRAREENGCTFLVAVELDAARAVMREVEARVRLHDDAVAQLLTLATAVRARVGSGVYLSPRPLAGVPIPSYDAVQRTFDLLYPDDRSTLFYLFRGREIHTSLVTVKRGGDVTHVTTHLAFNLPLRDWRRDYPKVLEAVEHRLARPHLGIFGELDAWQRIITGKSDGTARELARRDLIFDPAPPWLMGLVAADAGAQVAKASVGLLGRFVPQQVTQLARDLAGRAADRGPFALLGFNPFAVAAQLLRLRQPPAR